MSTIIGLLAALVSMLGWGSYFVPMKRVRRYDPFYFQALMCVAIFASSLIIASFYRSFVFSLFGVVSGILWAAGNILSVLAVKNSGLSRAAPSWMGTGIFVSFLWGLFFFKETLTSILAGVTGIILLIIGVFLVSSTGDDAKSGGNRKGVILAVVAGLLFGSYLVPLKLSGLQPIAFLFPMSIGILIGGMAIYLLKRSPVDKSIFLQGAFSGVLWNVANFASFFAVLNLGIAIGFPLTQMALFVSVLWGLLYFKEIQGKQKILKLAVGAVILFVGAILLALSG